MTPKSTPINRSVMHRTIDFASTYMVLQASKLHDHDFMVRQRLPPLCGVPLSPKGLSLHFPFSSKSDGLPSSDDLLSRKFDSSQVTGSSMSCANFSPALAPQESSGSKRIVAPLDLVQCTLRAPFGSVLLERSECQEARWACLFRSSLGRN